MAKKIFPKWATTVTPLSKTIALILFLILAIGGYYFGTQYRKISASASLQKQTVIQTEKPCSKQGIQPKSTYLKSYSVQAGDSLLSIAKNQLNDPSRIMELINMNKDKYPQLSMSQPFLEQGFTLFLPPKDRITNGYVFMISGKIKMNEDDLAIWEVKFDGGSGGTFLTKDLNGFKPGDCVNVLYQGGKDGKLFSVTRQ